jgi:hypothetical protein
VERGGGQGRDHRRGQRSKGTRGRQVWVCMRGAEQRAHLGRRVLVLAPRRGPCLKVRMVRLVLLLRVFPPLLLLLVPGWVSQAAGARMSTCSGYSFKKLLLVIATS